MAFKGQDPGNLYPEWWDRDETGWGYLSDARKKQLVKQFENIMPKVNNQMPIGKVIVFGTGGGEIPNTVDFKKIWFHSNDQNV